LKLNEARLICAAFAGSERRLTALLLIVLWFAPACQTRGPLEPVNLQAPGWTLREGQAIWRTSRSGPELAGDLLLATRNNSSFYVQFSKGPIPLITSQSSAGGWSVQLPAQNKRYSGRHPPPGRLIFLQLARLVAGNHPPNGWSWRHEENGRWKLENPRTGESVEGFLGP
jgi:hypothetical protein